LKKIFTPLAEKLTAAEKQIVSELVAVQGKPADIGGYYQPDDQKASQALRPSGTLNTILSGF
jgi:isocitrate dehydrogenase